jgi:hypothetical protein
VSSRELEALVGIKITAKHEMVLGPGGRLFGRSGDEWFEYPPYPAPCSTG